MDQGVANARDAVVDNNDGDSWAVGGVGCCDSQSVLIEALWVRDSSNLVTISNNCGVIGWGLGTLLSATRMACASVSYVAENEEFERQFLFGELGWSCGQRDF